MSASPLAEQILASHLSENFAKLADLFCYILWQQQEIYIQPYKSYDALKHVDEDLLIKGLRSILMSFETLKVDPLVYLNFNAQTGLLEDKMPLHCVGAEIQQPPTYITDLLFESTKL